MNPPTISQAISYFLLAKSGEVAASTLSWLEDMLAPILARYAAVPVNALAANDLRLYRLELRKQYSVATVNSYLRVWKQLYNWLIDEGLVEHSPLTRIKMLRPDKAKAEKVRAISLDGFTAILESAKAKRKLRDVAMIMLLYCTGCRVSGLVTLTMQQIDWQHGRVWIINKGRGKPYWGYFDQEGKTAAALHDYLAYERPATRSDYLFPGRGKTGHITRAQVYAMLKRHAARAGINEPANPHAFRHGFSVHMLLSGASLAVVSKLLGHSKIDITADTYGIFEQSHLQEAHGRYNPLKAVDVDLLKEQVNKR